MGAFLSAGSYLHHVHLASIKRNLPPGRAGLQRTASRPQDDRLPGLCSFECGVQGERESRFEVVKFLRSQWEKA